MRTILVVLGLLIAGCTPDSVSLTLWKSKSEYQYFEDQGTEDGIQMTFTWELGNE